jgi:mono/diheme cytochrome c family protein
MMTLKKHVSRLGLVVGSLSLVACGGGAAAGAGDTTGGEVSSQYAGPVQSTDTAAGEQAYQAACAPCHDGSAPQIAGLGWDAGRMRQQIREGAGQMPPIPASRLSDGDMEAILAYLQSVGGVQ